MSTDHYFDPWEWGRWKADPKVRRLSASSRCIWFEIIGDMWLEASSHWQGSAADLARAAGATQAEAEVFIAEAERTGVCDIERQDNGDVTLICRRRDRLESTKEKNRLRQQRHRARGKGNGRVTQEARPPNAGEVRDQKGVVDRGEDPEASRLNDLSGAAAPPRVWEIGKRLLGSERLFGKLIREHGEDRMRGAILRTLAHDPGEPRPFLIGCLKGDDDGTRERPGGKASAADRVREGALARAAARRKD